ncbi:MAG TPA: type II toxin-antitoxin system ParD family antitoxin [Stellaceae bacterium]|nr:type II toxin-antitoxin system ParD family antitoxin [Stellaceae bacterium]
MASINLGEHFEQFVRDRIARGRYQNASEVVRAGLRLLEASEMDLEARASFLKEKIDEAWDDPRPSVPADEAFGRVEALHEDAVRQKRRRA